MKMMGRLVTKVLSCALLLLAVAAYQPALADCAGNSIYFGNGGVTLFRFDVFDPAASWKTYILQNPAINQGTVPVGLVAVDLGDPQYGGEPGTALVFGDWTGGLGMEGCPFSLETVTANQIIDDENINQVFIFSDSKNGTVVLVLKSEGNNFNFDTAFPEGELPRFTMTPRLLSGRTSSSTVDVELAWDAPVILSDPASANLAATLVRGYRIFETRRSASGADMSTAEVADGDGSTTDSHAMVSLVKGGPNETSVLSVAADLAGGAGVGASVRGFASSSIQNSGFAVNEPKGKGKGLSKAPGQSK